MPGDDPSEKSLFTRIKDCVLVELRRSNGEVKRAPCPSKRTWVWKNDENNSGTEHSGREKREKDEFREKSVQEKNAEIVASEQDSDREVSRAGESAETHKNVEKKAEQENLKLNDEKESEMHKKIPSRGIEKEKEKTRIEAEKGKSTDQQDSCGSNKFKPIRYYIKMQNPEAPVCCESLKPRKVCPPKTRKSQQQAPADSYASRPACRCGGCSSGENNWYNEE